jgi:hypothetical protein
MDIDIGALIRVSLVFCPLLAGCSLQFGLANAPVVINAGTTETRVHDVVANGRDSCERRWFPPGQVLRGEIPPCVKTERLPRVATFVSPPSAWIAPL